MGTIGYGAVTTDYAAAAKSEAKAYIPSEPEDDVDEGQDAEPLAHGRRADGRRALRRVQARHREGEEARRGHG